MEQMQPMMQAQNPTLSVIVPVYRVEQYLEKCIRSILGQTMADLELILVDDGSPDGCPALCDAAAEQDPRVRVIHQKNGGLSAARNAGLDIARGEWIGFVDSDDFVALDLYRTLLDRVRADGTKLAICSLVYVDENGVPLPNKPSPITKDEVVSREQALNRMFGSRFWYYVVAYTRLYHRSLFEDLRFPAGRVHEDEFAAHHLLWKCSKISLVAQGLYFYVQRSGSIMANGFTAKRLDAALAYLDRTEFALEHRLNALAEASYQYALEIIAEAIDRKLQDERLDQARGQARQLLPRMIRTARNPIHGIKFRLYRCSPLLFRRVHQVQGRVQSALQGKK